MFRNHLNWFNGSLKKSAEVGLVGMRPQTIRLFAILHLLFSFHVVVRTRTDNIASYLTE